MVGELILIGELVLIGELEQGATVDQQSFNVVETGDLLGIPLPLAIKLQLRGFQTLLQPHQPLGEGVHGLGQILSITADAEGNRLESHGNQGMGADHNTQTSLSQAQSASLPQTRLRPKSSIRWAPVSLLTPQAMALKMTFGQIPGLRRALLVLLGSAAGFGLALPGQAQTAEANTAAANAGSGGKGAQIYCFMRNSGNSHQVSWDAAYAVIKRQNDKLFKTSPEHAAVMITEAVVQNPSVFPDCGRYLGDLFAKPEAKPEASTSPAPGGTSRNERLGQ